MENREPRKITFGAGWIIANGFAWGVFYILVIAIRWVEGQIFPGIMLRFLPLVQVDFFTGALIGSVACGLIWGTLAGSLQQLALRRQLVQKGKWWILATMIGLLPLAIYLFIYQLFIVNPAFPGDSLARLEKIFGVAGYTSPLWFGVAQWLVLRRTFRKAAWWVLAAALVVGLVTFSFRASSLALLVFRPHHGFLLIAPGVIGLLYALLTWLVLALIPGRSLQESNNA